MKLDWVVNEDTYGRLALGIVPAGTITMAPLTYPRFVVNESITGASLGRGGYGWPEGEKQFVKAVVGHLSFTVAAWAAGTLFYAIARITKKPMDLATGAAIADASYSLDLDQFANERFAWQGVWLRETVALGAVGPPQTVQVRANVNQWLEPDEALYLSVHNLGNIDLGYRPMLRTLMKAES